MLGLNFSSNALQWWVQYTVLFPGRLLDKVILLIILHLLWDQFKDKTISVVKPPRVIKSCLILVYYKLLSVLASNNLSNSLIITQTSLPGSYFILSPVPETMQPSMQPFAFSWLAVTAWCWTNSLFTTAEAACQQLNSSSCSFSAAHANAHYCCVITSVLPLPYSLIQNQCS